MNDTWTLEIKIGRRLFSFLRLLRFFAAKSPFFHLIWLQKGTKFAKTEREKP